jgi:hypothetical protein
MKETITVTGGGATTTTNKDGYGNILSTGTIVYTYDSHGNQTEDKKTFNPDGSLADEIIIKTKNNGGLTTYDDLGGGLRLASNSDITTIDSAGIKTQDFKGFGPDGSLLVETITVTSADGNTITVTNKDGSGNIVSTSIDVTTTDSQGIKTEDYQKFNADGSLIEEVITKTAASGNTSKITRKNGQGTILGTSTKTITTDPSGAKIEEDRDYNANGTLKDETITKTSADGNTIEITNKDGNGNILGSSTEVTTADASGIKTKDHKEFDADGSLKTETATTYNTDNSCTALTYNAATGVRTEETIIYDGSGGYDDTWTADDGTWGEISLFDNGGSLSITNNPDSSSVTKTYDASTGIYDCAVVKADGSYTDYQTAYGTDGSYKQTWATNDGSWGETDYDPDGSMLSLVNLFPYSNRAISNTSTYNASTGVYGFDVVFYEGSYVNAEASQDGNGNWIGTGIAYCDWADTYYNAQITYDGLGGYQESWTASDGEWGEDDEYADGSYMQSRHYEDGSYYTETYDASTGDHSEEHVGADGSWSTDTLTHDGQGGYRETRAWSNGSWSEYDYFADNSWSFTGYDAGAGSTEIASGDGRGGRQDRITYSNGSWSEDDRADNGSEVVTCYDAQSGNTLTRTYSSYGYLISSEVTDSTGNAYFLPSGSSGQYVVVGSTGDVYLITIDQNGGINKQYLGQQSSSPEFPGVALPGSGSPGMAAGLGQSYEDAAISTLASGQGMSSAVLEGAKWNSQVITWSIADSPSTASTPFSNYMSTAYETAIQDAFNTWSAATGITFEELPDSAQSDIRIGWGEFNTAITGKVGDTTYETNNARFLPGVTIRLEDPVQDALVAGADGQLTYAGTQADFSQALVHEIGHALGLADNTDPNSVMCYALGTNNRGLDSTDLAGIQTLYESGPKGAPASSPVNTGLDQLVQAMATFEADKGAPVTPVTPQSYAVETNHLLAVISRAGIIPV